MKAALVGVCGAPNVTDIVSLGMLPHMAAVATAIGEGLRADLPGKLFIFQVPRLGVVCQCLSLVSLP